MDRAWQVVLISALILAITLGTTINAFSLFVMPVSSELGISRANMNTAFILFNIGMATLAPFVGRMLDLVPTKWVMSFSAMLLAVSFTVIGLSPAMWLSALVMGLLLPAGVLGAGTITISILLARRFTKHRGRAMLLAQIGAPAGALLVTPTIAWLIAWQGWRSALLMMAAAVAALLMILTAIVKARFGMQDIQGDSPSSQHQAPSDQLVRLRPTHILKLPQFWMVAFAYSLPLSFAQATGITIVPLAIERGLTMIQATSLLSLSGGSAIMAVLLLARFADRISRPHLLLCLALLGSIFALALLLASSYELLLIAVVAIGAATGAVPPLIYALLADSFGTPSLGTARGLIMPVSALMTAFAIRFSGEVYDRTGGYELFFAAFCLAQIVTGLMLYLLIVTERRASASSLRAQDGEAQPAGRAEAC